MGKHKPIYDPSTDCGDYVVVTNCHDLHTTGKKRMQKKYYTHTTRPGSLKEITMERLIAKWGGGEVLRRAVRGMLPKNRLRDDRMARLKCECLALPPLRESLMLTAATGFEGQAHPYKQNILKLGSESSIAGSPDVQAAFAQQSQAQPLATTQH